MAKFSVKKALAIVGCVTALGAGVFFGLDYVSDDFNVVFHPENTPVQPVDPIDPDKPDDPVTPPVEAIKLATPKITYNQEDNILSWEPVENAEKYLLTINGYAQEVTETNFQLDIEENSNYVIKVKALGDGEKFADSEEATLSGYRQDLEQAYYEKIQENIYKFFETYRYDGRTLTVVEKILNVDYVDNKFSVLIQSKLEGQTEEYLTEFKNVTFDLTGIYEPEEITLKTMAEASTKIHDVEIRKISYLSEANKYFGLGESCYEKLISDSRLTGSFKEHLNAGYTATKLYSEVTGGTMPDNFTVTTCVKLQKGNDIKVVTIHNLVSQKYNPSLAFKGYVNSYINGTAEEVKIEEIYYSEKSNASSLWQSANDKYENIQENVENILSSQHYETQYATISGKQVKLTFPTQSYSPEL